MGNTAAGSGGGFGRCGRHRQLSKSAGITTDGRWHISPKTGSSQDLSASRTAGKRAGEGVAATRQGKLLIAPNNLIQTPLNRA